MTIIDEPVTAVDAEREAVKEATRVAFENTEMVRLSELCGYTDEGYEALLDAIADQYLAAGALVRSAE